MMFGKKLCAYNSPLKMLRLGFSFEGIQLRGYIKLVLFFLKHLLSFPLILWESLFLSHQIKAVQLQHPPVFILGHYRSGTTLLHKLLAKDPNKAAIRNYDLLFPFHPTWLRKILQPIFQKIIDRIGILQPAFNNIPYSLQDPNEDDIYFIHFPSPLSAYWGYIFPKRALYFLHQAEVRQDIRERERWQQAFLYHIKKLIRKKGNRQLILKSPPHTARIDLILELFPDAQFIYLHRDPVGTYYSMEKLWKSTILKHYAVQSLEQPELEEVIFAHYRYLIGHYQAQKALIPNGQLVELTFEELNAQPMESLKRIFKVLDIGPLERAIHYGKSLLQRESGYQRYRYDFDKEMVNRIQKEWEDDIRSPMP